MTSPYHDPGIDELIVLADIEMSYPPPHALPDYSVDIIKRTPKSISLQKPIENRGRVIERPSRVNSESEGVDSGDSLDDKPFRLKLENVSDGIEYYI